MNQLQHSVETQAAVAYREHLPHPSAQDEAPECTSRQQQSDGVTNLSSVSRPMKNVAKADQREEHSAQSPRSDREPPRLASRDIKEDVFSLFTNDTDVVVIDSVTVPIVEEPLYMQPDEAWKCLSHKGQAFADKSGKIVALEELDFHQQVAWLSMMTRGELWMTDGVKPMATGENITAEHDGSKNDVRRSPSSQHPQATMVRAGDSELSSNFEGSCEVEVAISRSAVPGATCKSLTNPSKSGPMKTIQPLQFGPQPSVALTLPEALVIPKVLPISGKKAYRIKYHSTRAQLNRFNNRKSLSTLVLESLVSQGRVVLIRDAIIGGRGKYKMPTRGNGGGLCLLSQGVRGSIKILQVQLSAGQGMGLGRRIQGERGDGEWGQFDDGEERKEEDVEDIEDNWGKGGIRGKDIVDSNRVKEEIENEKGTEGV
ncbi:hypothetical protein KC360_g1992 [Hortaea werneckii]|nr:hypothetical protein KC361_g3808 [Hortaea werneckii]KAI6886038.1 hypothetical protein KC325_g3121 [Hortaea werneckii]KAI6995647.1 hypothetical protein KC359_g3938 [Hortaea werneckii]KAI7146469.1 hypothetical protein KC344_g3626 [Hortaea werneckii]KAI7177829.1 hypothetical protein KC360_g1992 [Hortaea werneckii]